MTQGDAEYRIEKYDAPSEGSGRNLREYGTGASKITARRDVSREEKTVLLMEAVVERENMRQAYQRVLRNKGAAGVDRMSVADLKAYLMEHWSQIKTELLAGSYQPAPVQRVEIPKPGGKGMRILGIPTVLDRLIQQALHQVLNSVFDQGFSESSYGFRPGRSAHQAVLQARRYVGEGRRWVVDLDLEKFFDRVNHDILMSRLVRKIKDKRVLGLIRRYLQADMMSGGLISPRREGTPQGGPLSPLLSNILLDDFDRELERRGHCFCRYADDCNIYVRSRRAGYRVLRSVTRFLERELKLRVNSTKSAVDRPWNRTFLGYSMTFHMKPRLKVPVCSVDRLKAKIREVMRRGRGRNLRHVIEELTLILRGWVNYFRWVEVKGVLEELDGWIRRKLRCILWRQWKRPFTRAKNLMKRGLSEQRSWQSAKNQRGPWWNAGASHMHRAFPKSYFDRFGLVSLLDQHRRLKSIS